MPADGTVKLSDFGLGALAEARAADGMLRTVCGTPNYAAPEVLASQPYRGGSADLWSLGEPPRHRSAEGGLRCAAHRWFLLSMW